MTNLNLEDIDVDGAIGETASAVLGDTRASFLRKGVIAGGALAGSGALMGALAPGAFAKSFSTGDRPPASFGAGDVGILNFALTLEYLESTFYNEALQAQNRNPFLTTAQERVFLQTVQHDENAHVALLRKALGSKAIAKPKFDFHGTNTQAMGFWQAAFGFENVGVHAYSGQAFNIKSPEYLAAALSIVTIEARHASVAGLLRNESEYGLTPSGAFDTPQGATEVLKEVTSLNYIQS